MTPSIKHNRASRTEASGGEVRERLLAGARRLFYREGYAATGINRLLAETGVSRAGLYGNFPSKKDLAREYLNRYADELSAQLRTFARKCENPREFFELWMKLHLREEKKSREFNGCPLANFAAAQDTRNNEWLDTQLQATDRWKEILIDYFNAATKRGHIPAGFDSTKLADETLIIYEGALVMWKMTARTAYLKQGFELIIAHIAGEKE